jgi:carboxypeptidase Taq
VLSWDNAVMMPNGGAEARAEQMATLSALHHELLTSPRIADDLDAAEQGRAALDAWQAANLREMRRIWRHATALPADLVEQRSRINARAEMVWREARAADDFALLRPHFEEVVRLVREVGAAKAEALGLEPYDALMESFEPDARKARIDPVFTRLAEAIPSLLDAVLERQAAASAPQRPKGPFPIEAQRGLAVRLMEALGFDFRHGRLDISHHPFTGGVPDDVRITTRYSEEDFAESLMGVLHETGHALYERGLPAKWREQPVGDARGMVLHESQSLLIEMQLCRSRDFLTFAAPLMRETFGGGGTAWSVDSLTRSAQRVSRGLIRVDADEVTYPLHVILRYRLEQAMLAGDLAARDLPGAWNDGIRSLLGVVPPDDRAGCLQDIHWPAGAFGYFPTYTLGALAAAQLFQAAKAALPDLAADVRQGSFAGLLAWLRDNVHGLGSRQSTDEILTAVTGEPLGADAFLAHLETRYLSDGD